MKNKHYISIFLCIIILIGSAAITSGIGLSPGKKSIHYAPNESIDVSFTSANTGQETMYVEVVKRRGDLLDYVSCVDENEPYIEIPPQMMYAFSCSITVPADLEPGSHSAYYGIASTDPFATEEKTIAIQTSALTTLEMFVPYPEKYIQVHHSVEHVLEGQDTPYSIAMTNLGTDAVDVFGTITVDLGNGQSLVQELSQTQLAQPYEEYTYTGNLQTSTLQGGFYPAKISLEYGEVFSDEIMIQIGNKMARVYEFESITVKKDEITKVPILLQSNWVEPIDVYAEIVFTKENGESFTVKTDTQTITSASTGTINAFIEPKEAGVYGAAITTKVVDGVQHTETFNDILVVEGEHDVGPWLLILSIVGIVVAIFGLLYIKKKTKKIDHEKNHKVMLGLVMLVGTAALVTVFVAPSLKIPILGAATSSGNTEVIVLGSDLDFTISSDSIDFGTLLRGQSNETSVGGNPPAINITNTGGITQNYTINFSNELFLTGENGTTIDAFAFRCTNLTHNCSSNAWRNASPFPSTELFEGNVSPSPNQDMIALDIRVQVPGNETSENKSVTISIEAVAT